MEKKPNLPLNKETLEALNELGEIFRGIHERMNAEGYTIVDGKIEKINATNNDESNYHAGKAVTAGDIER